MIYTYRPKGVCAQLMEFEVDDNIIKDVKIMGGCNGNLKGISSLILGMDINEVIKRLKGIKCGMKTSSCPDQIALALEQLIAEQ